MAILGSIRQLYKLFDEVFPHPKSFHNDGCCVGKKHAKLLATLPREELTEEMLSVVVDHRGCFGTFEEMAYFVPRLMELLADSEDGFEHGLLQYSFFGLLRENEQQYRDLGLWNSIEEAMYDIFVCRTSTFDIKHYDEVECRQKGWEILYFDIMPWQDLIDQMLGGFFYPILSARKSDSNLQLTAWDRFFIKWAEDENPYRLAHLMDIIKRYCNDDLYYGYVLPDSLINLLKEKDYQLILLEHTRTAYGTIDTPTWLRDAKTCLEMLMSN